MIIPLCYANAFALSSFIANYFVRAQQSIQFKCLIAEVLHQNITKVIKIIGHNFRLCIAFPWSLPPHICKIENQFDYHCSICQFTIIRRASINSHEDNTTNGKHRIICFVYHQLITLSSNRSAVIGPDMIPPRGKLHTSEQKLRCNLKWGPSNSSTYELRLDFSSLLSILLLSFACYEQPREEKRQWVSKRDREIRIIR